MRHVVVGAGQIGTQLVREIRARGEEVTVVRRSSALVEGAPTVRADAGDADALAPVVAGADAIHLCLHASAYDPRVWRAELPRRERTVMDLAAEAGVPVVFPESVYAFGHQAEALTEGARPDPCSPLGEVRAELLAARAAHPARTVSIVASDLLGPTASATAAVGVATVVGPVARGRRAWVLGDPSRSHSWTAIPDLARAMVLAAHRASALAPTGDVVLHAPTGAPHSLRELALATGDLVGRRPRLTPVPHALVAGAGLLHAPTRSLADQSYLWRRPCVLAPGRLATTEGLAPTPWPELVRSTVEAVTAVAR